MVNYGLFKLFAKLLSCLENVTNLHVVLKVSFLKFSEAVFVKNNRDLAARRRLHLVNYSFRVHDRFSNLFEFSEGFRFLEPRFGSRDEF